MRAKDELGRRGEEVASAYLKQAGIRILDRNWRCAEGEIDIVARRGRVVAFVEVTARADLVTAGESVGARQRRRIARAARAFLQKRPELQQLDLRFDVVLLAPWRLPVHISDAWRE